MQAFMLFFLFLLCSTFLLTNALRPPNANKLERIPKKGQSINRAKRYGHYYGRRGSGSHSGEWNRGGGRWGYNNGWGGGGGYNGWGNGNGGYYNNGWGK